MKKLKQQNWYKITCITLAVVITVTMYSYGMPSALDSLAQWRNGGMPTEIAKCSMFASEHLMKVVE